MDYELLEKMKVEELKNYLKIRGLKVTGIKKELIARVFAASENGVQPVKAAVEIESHLSLITKKNLKLMISQYLTHLRYLMGGWKKMKEWHFSQCYHTQIYLIF